jgi:hypothetical protein
MMDLSLSESLSLFFPHHSIHPAVRRIKKRLLTLVPHTSLTFANL